MKYKLSILFLVLFLSIFQFDSIAQPENDTVVSTLHKVITNSGIEYIGELISDDGREILINTETLGRIYIPKSEIKSMTKIKSPEKIVDGRYREEGPFTSRYYFTTNALPIKKGEDYAMIHLYGPEVHFALTNKFSLGVMSSWIASPIGLAAKYSFNTNNEKLNLSLGTILLHSGYIRVNNKSSLGGLHWGSITYGSTINNISLTAGYGYTNFRFDNGIQYAEMLGLKKLTSAPIVSIAGIKQVGKKASFIFDSMIALHEHINYQRIFISGGDFVILYNRGMQASAILMPGVRFQTTERQAFQFAMSGVLRYSEVGFNYQETITEDTQKLSSFPMPMCSWFFKF